MISAHGALERLREGSHRFISGMPHRDGTMSNLRRAELTKEQHPFSIVLGCSDSRVPVEIVAPPNPRWSTLRIRSFGPVLHRHLERRGFAKSCGVQTRDPLCVSRSSERIDDQHKMLFKMAEDFEEALDKGRGTRLYGGLLQSLNIYVRAHFSFEERCMDEHRCPVAQRNKEAHANLLDVLSGYRQRFEAKGSTVQMLAVFRTP